MAVSQSNEGIFAQKQSQNIFLFFSILRQFFGTICVMTKRSQNKFLLHHFFALNFWRNVFNKKNKQISK